MTVSELFPGFVSECLDRIPERTGTGRVRAKVYLGVGSLPEFEVSQIPVRVAKPVCQVPDDRLAPVSSLLSVDSVLVILLRKIN